MCGIAGMIGDYSSLDVKNLSNSMHHRGPDGISSYKEKNFCLIHSLLKIMDLSDNSAQPMIDERNGNVIIFNGSIYNYKILKQKFFSGTKFKSNTDTEVILFMYEKFGLDLFKHIKGMFAFALYDKKSNKIILGRDRYGIKPLFYFSNEKSLIFASEIKILLTQKIIKDNIKIDINEILKFIGHRIISGFNKTLLKNIKVLEPSTYLIFNLSKRSFKIFSYNSDELNLSMDQENNQEYFDQKLNEVIRLQTITEHKKIACFLSGGLDSSLLSTILKIQAKEKEVHTFSSILNNPNEENKNIQKLVDENNFIHHHINEDSFDFFDAHLKTIYDMDQPTPDAATTIHNLLCKEVSKNGFKVLFSGNGGDEHFFGYPLHVYGYLASNLNFNILKYFSKISQLKNFYNPNEIIIRSIKEALSNNILNKFKMFQLSNRLKHLDGEFDLDKINFYEDLSDNIFKNIVCNYKTHWGMQSFLDYEDKNSMAYGIECRVPYLDYDLADLSFKTKIDHHFKFGSKTLLRKNNCMPKYIAKSKNKFGFAANLQGYLEKNFNKIKDKIFYEFDDIPLIDKTKLINLASIKKKQDIFFRTYSYGLWYKNLFSK